MTENCGERISGPSNSFPLTMGDSSTSKVQPVYIKNYDILIFFLEEEPKQDEHRNFIVHNSGIVIMSHKRRIRIARHNINVADLENAVDSNGTSIRGVKVIRLKKHHVLFEGEQLKV